MDKFSVQPILDPNIPSQSPMQSQPEILTAPVEPKRSKTWLIFACLLIVLAAVGYYIYPRVSSNDEDLPLGSPSATSDVATSATSKLSGFTPIADAANTIVYTTDDDVEQAGDEQIILLNLSTNATYNLPINRAVSVFKYYGSNLLYYLSPNQLGEYSSLDLTTGIVTVYDLLDHTDPSVSISLQIQNINEVAPDGKYFIFQGSYTTVCPSPSPFPSGFEGGFGPCGPEESIENPTGYFLYDVSRKKSIYLSNNTIRVIRWDTQKQNLYFTDYGIGNTTKMLDLASKSISIIDSTESFGYFTYPFVNSRQIVKFEGDAGTDGSTPFGRIYLYDLAGQSKKDIDSVNTWTGIQPFITVSPNESKVLYRRSNTINGIGRSSIYIYDVKTGSTKQISKVDDSLSYNIYVTWLDDNTIITSVDTIEEDNYRNSNQYLVKINLSTGEETRLTDKGNIRYFNTQ